MDMNSFTLCAVLCDRRTADAIFSLGAHSDNRIRGT